ncbi:MAG TPA: preprotein translocase subunit SecG [Tepidisphaeraceae bacterium]|jgi:protein translocase SecG subunit|nr:preprotein translocase subunit SecG [Tepidisphaeraceae bacterium]
MTILIQAAFIVVSVLLTAMVLIQAGRGRSVPGIFGGAGGDTILGPQAAGAMTWATSIVFALFLVLAIALSLVH